MIPTFLSFETASRALAASQANLNTTGNNIANVNTEGYTRQRTDLSSVTTSGFNQKYATPETSSALGVEVTGTSQIRDAFLDVRYRNENSDNGMYSTLLSKLTELENVIDEASNDGLEKQLSDFANQLQTFSGSPTSEDIALIVKTSAQKVTQIMNVYAQQISEVREQAIYDLNNVVVENDFNTTLENIANLNKQIKTEELYGNTPNELYDKRNVLIDNLSKMADIKVSTTSTEISKGVSTDVLSISIYNAADPENPIELVKDGQFNTLSVKTNDDGNVSININRSFGGDGKADSNITNVFSSGSIKGYVDIINGAGTYADTASGENNFRGTLYYQNSMDTFARTFAQVFNNINDTNATDSATKPLFSASDGSGIITASNIAISKEWSKDSAYISTGITNPKDNDNILKMVAAMNADTVFSSLPTASDADGNVKFTGTFTECVTGMIGELSLDIRLNDNFADTSDVVLISLFKSRESASGISLDEEGIDLLAYQKSYNAAARFMTVLDEQMDTLINNMGVVGR